MMSSVPHMIQNDTSTAISQAPAPLSSAMRKDIDSSLVHHCSTEDATEALKHMHANKQYLVRKAEDSGTSQVRWYKVSTRNHHAILHELYEDCLLYTSDAADD